MWRFMTTNPYMWTVVASVKEHTNCNVLYMKIQAVKNTETYLAMWTARAT